MKNLNQPNLFIIGAMKSGTTYLHDLLSSHPDIFMSRVKEPCYFVAGAELKKLAPQMWNLGIWENTDKYGQLFADVQTEKIIGESTTLYTKFPTLKGVPERIHDFNKEARLIYVMRDPIERTISHYWHNVRVTSNMKEVVTALKTDPHYQYVSYYAMQIKQYLKYFKQNQIYLCTFEELIRNSEDVVKDIYSWFGLDKDVTIGGLNEPKNVAPKSMIVSKTHFLTYRFRKSPAVIRLMNLIPYSVQKVLTRLSSRPVDKVISDLTEVVDYLRPTQLKETEELEALLGRQFPEWTTLNAP